MEAGVPVGEADSDAEEFQVARDDTAVPVLPGGMSILYHGSRSSNSGDESNKSQVFAVAVASDPKSVRCAIAIDGQKFGR